MQVIHILTREMGGIDETTPLAPGAPRYRSSSRSRSRSHLDLTAVDAKIKEKAPRKRTGGSGSGASTPNTIYASRSVGAALKKSE